VPIKSNLKTMQATAPQLTEFTTLSITDRLKSLVGIEMAYSTASPLLCQYLPSFMRQFRDRVRATSLSGLDTFGDVIKELYYTFRASFILCDVEAALHKICETKDAPQKELCVLLEFAEDLLTECFNALPWSEAHQKEWVALQPEIQRQQLMRFVQTMTANAELFGVERTVKLTNAICQLIQSSAPDQCITSEQMIAAFEVK
jgi:hypothetical protein